jgi:hypothetical protein
MLEVCIIISYQRFMCLAMILLARLQTVSCINEDGYLCAKGYFVLCSKSFCISYRRLTGCIFLCLACIKHSRRCYVLLGSEGAQAPSPQLSPGSKLVLKCTDHLVQS